MIRVRYAKETKRDRKEHRVILQIGLNQYHLSQKEVTQLHRELAKRKVKR